MFGKALFTIFVFVQTFSTTYSIGNLGEPCEPTGEPCNTGICVGGTCVCDYPYDYFNGAQPCQCGSGQAKYPETGTCTKFADQLAVCELSEQNPLGWNCICLYGTSPNATTQSCDCPGGQVFDSVTQKCKCPQYSTLTNGQCTCGNITYQATNGTCVAFNASTCVEGDSGWSCQCLPTTSIGSDGKSCVCPGTQVYNTTTQSCVCPGNQVYNTTTHSCNCPPYSTLATSGLCTCVDNTSQATNGACIPFSLSTCIDGVSGWSCQCLPATSLGSDGKSCVCPGNQVYNTTTSSCNCPPYSALLGGLCTCGNSVNTKTYSVTGGSCAAYSYSNCNLAQSSWTCTCPSPTTPNPSTESCDCPECSTRNSTGGCSCFYAYATLSGGNCVCQGASEQSGCSCVAFANSVLVSGIPQCQFSYGSWYVNSATGVRTCGKAPYGLLDTFTVGEILNGVVTNIVTLSASIDLTALVAYLAEKILSL